jgi:hypothetical protein
MWRGRWQAILQLAQQWPTLARDFQLPTGGRLKKQLPP